MDDLLAGTLISSFVEFQCRLLSSAVAGSCCSSVKNIPFQAERHSGKATKTVRLATGMAFTFTTEYCSDSQRNGVRLQTGIAFIFDRIPQKTTGAPVCQF
jgi:hypothetical protein